MPSVANRTPAATAVMITSATTSARSSQQLRNPTELDRRRVAELSRLGQLGVRAARIHRSGEIEGLGLSTESKSRFLNRS